MARNLLLLIKGWYDIKLNVEENYIFNSLDVVTYCGGHFWDNFFLERNLVGTAIPDAGVQPVKRVFIIMLDLLIQIYDKTFLGRKVLE